MCLCQDGGLHENDRTTTRNDGAAIIGDDAIPCGRFSHFRLLPLILTMTSFSVIITMASIFSKILTPYIKESVPLYLRYLTMYPFPDCTSIAVSGATCSGKTALSITSS